MVVAKQGGLSQRDRSSSRIGPVALSRPDPQAFGESSARSIAIFRVKCPRISRSIAV